jgi:hypothetical protein
MRDTPVGVGFVAGVMRWARGAVLVATAAFGVAGQTASAVAPVPGTMMPSASSGAGELLTFTFSDPNGAEDISVARVLINSSQVASGGCYVAWDRRAGAILLADNYGWSWSAAQAGGAGTVANSQCTVRGAGSSVSVAGTVLTLVLDVRFQAAFNGPKKVWANASDGGGLTGQSLQLGTYTVAVENNVAPAVGSLVPAAGSGESQRFSVTYTDANGGLDIVRARLLINGSQTAVGGCFVEIDRVTGLVWLADDQGVGWTSAHLGTAEMAQNGQCVVSGAGTSWSADGMTLQAVFEVSFRPSFPGAKNVYANATDAGGLTSAAPLIGTYTVTSSLNQSPVAVSITPSTGSGPAQVFTIRWTDGNGAADIAVPRVLIHSQQRADWGCYLAFAQPAGTVSLADDAGHAWTSASLGSTGVLSNSQCTVRASGSALSPSGTTLTATADVVFKEAFNGLKSIWVNATDARGLTSPAPQLGTFQVNVTVNRAPVPVSVVPSSGVGNRQSFSFVWTDDNGGTDIETPRVLINSTQRAAGGCYIAAARSAGLLYLADDAGVSWTLVRAGTADTAQNSQCRLYGASSSLSVVSNSLTVVLDIGFQPAFAGTMSVWANATDLGGMTSPAPLLGTYTAYALGSPHSVTLNWVASTSVNVTGYKVYRATVSGGPYTLLTSTAIAALTYADSVVLAGQTYYYVVTAVNNAGLESSYSNQAVAVIPTP